MTNITLNRNNIKNNNSNTLSVIFKVLIILVLFGLMLYQIYSLFNKEEIPIIFNDSKLNILYFTILLNAIWMIVYCCNNNMDYNTITKRLVILIDIWTIFTSFIFVFAIYKYDTNHSIYDYIYIITGISNIISIIMIYFLYSQLIKNILEIDLIKKSIIIHQEYKGDLMYIFYPSNENIIISMKNDCIEKISFLEEPLLNSIFAQIIRKEPHIKSIHHFQNPQELSIIIEKNKQQLENIKEEIKYLLYKLKDYTEKTISYNMVNQRIFPYEVDEINLLIRNINQMNKDIFNPNANEYNMHEQLSNLLEYNKQYKKLYDQICEKYIHIQLEIEDIYLTKEEKQLETDDQRIERIAKIEIRKQDNIQKKQILHMQKNISTKIEDTIDDVHKEYMDYNTIKYIIDTKSFNVIINI